MNYLTEIKMFYDWLETHNLSAKGIVLWHGLMQIASRSGWKTPLEIPSSTLEMRTHLERTTIFRERNRLVDAGLIRLCQNGGRSACAYILIPLSRHFALQGATQNPSQEQPLMLQGETQTDDVMLQDATQNTENRDNSNDVVLQVALHNETQSATQNQSIPLLSNKTKLNNKENNKRKIEVADESAPEPINSKSKREKSCAQKEKTKSTLFDPNRWLETVDSAWREVMRQWLEYKSARKQTYKTELGAQKCLSMLKDLSHNNPRTAQAIIDQSIANNWAGLFALRDNGTTSRGQPDPNRPQYGQRIGQIMQTEDEAKRQRIIERLRNAGKVTTQ